MSALRSIASICGSSQSCIAAASRVRASLIFLIRSCMRFSLSIQGAAELLGALVDDALGLELVARQRIGRHRLALQAHVQRLVNLVAELLRHFPPSLAGNRFFRLELHR